MRTRNQGESPGGFKTLDSPFFKRTRKLPKKKRSPEVETTAETVDESSTSAQLQSIVTYAAPDTTSPSVSPEPEESRSPSPPPSDANTTSSRHRPNPNDVIKKPSSRRQARNTQRPSTHQGAGPSGTRRTTRRTITQQDDTSDDDVEQDARPVKVLRSGRPITSTSTSKPILGKRNRTTGSDIDERPLKRRQELQAPLVFDSPEKTLIRSVTHRNPVDDQRVHDQDHKPSMRTLTKSFSHGISNQDIVSEVQDQQPTTKPQLRRTSLEVLDVEATIAQRMNQPKLQMKKPKMILASHPTYDETIESDDELLERAQDTVKYCKNLKTAERYLKDEKKKAIDCGKAGKPYVVPTPIKQITLRKSNIGSPSAKSTTNQVSQSFKFPQVPYVLISAARGHEQIILTDAKIIDALRAVAQYATRSPSKSLPDSQEIVAFIEAAKSSSSTTPSNSQEMDASSEGPKSSRPTSLPNSQETVASFEAPKPSRPSIRLMPRKIGSSTYFEPESESDNDSDPEVEITTHNNDKDQLMAESDSEVAPPATPQSSKSIEKTPVTPQSLKATETTTASQGWGLFSAVKNIVASPVKFFSGSKQAAVAPQTNNQKLDLAYQATKPVRADGRGATPKSATARRTLQSLKSKTIQSERKAAPKEKPYIPMHLRGVAELDLAIAKRKKEFEEEQVAVKAKQRKEAELNHKYPHIDNHRGTFTVPEDSESDSDMEEEPSESPLVRKIAQPKKTVTWSDQLSTIGYTTKKPSTPSKWGGVRVFENYVPVKEKTPSPGLWTMQTQWYFEGKNLEEFNALTAAFEEKENAKKKAIEEHAAAVREEERERNRALWRKDARDREKREAAENAKTTHSVGGGWKWNRSSASVNETHGNGTNPDGVLLEAASSRSGFGTNPGNLPVNENNPKETPDTTTLAEQSANVMTRQEAYMQMVADDYFSGRDVSRSPYVQQKINPFYRTKTEQEVRRHKQWLNSEEGKAAEQAKAKQKAADEADWLLKKAQEGRVARSGQTSNGGKTPLGEIQNLQASTVLEHPSVSAAKASATKYSPKKPSNLRTVHTLSPLQASSSLGEDQENQKHYSIDELKQRCSVLEDELFPDKTHGWVGDIHVYDGPALPVQPVVERLCDLHNMLESDKFVFSMRRLSIQDDS